MREVRLVVQGICEVSILFTTFYKCAPFRRCMVNGIPETNALKRKRSYPFFFPFSLVSHVLRAPEISTRCRSFGDIEAIASAWLQDMGFVTAQICSRSLVMCDVLM